VAAVLAEEFGVPFRLYDAEGGEELPIAEGPLTENAACTPAPAAIQELARHGANGVRALGEGHYKLTLVLHDARRPVLVAVGTLEGVAAGAHRQAREQERLHKWLQAVGERIRLGEQVALHRAAEQEQSAQIARTWTALLGLDEAIHNTRIHKDLDRSRQAVLKAAHQHVGVQAVLWVAGTEEFVAEGEAVLARSDYRPLADLLGRHNPEARRVDPVLWNEDRAALWSARFPQIANLLAVTVSGPQGRSWLIAVNKIGPRNPSLAGPDRPPQAAPFRKADAAVLMPFASLLSLQARSARRIQDLRELLVGLTRSLTAAIDAKDSYTYGHSERVARVGVELGRQMGLSEDDLSDVYLAGLLHDIGKIGIPDSILTKPGKLTTEEFEHLKQHPVIGYNILKDLGPLNNLLPGVLYHHERYDGKGYPEGLSGKAIPLLARVLAVADAYDAMSTSRPYRPAMAAAEVEAQLQHGAGTQWDRRVIEAFLRARQEIHLVRQRGVGESLNQALEGALRTGESSKIVPVVVSAKLALWAEPRTGSPASHGGSR
jgi:HD-GYP domain-containing protein (c-di-GMP phosphodiesterase class II)